MAHQAALFHDDLEVSPSGFVWPCPGLLLSYFRMEPRTEALITTVPIDIADAGIMGADVVAAKEGVVMILTTVVITTGVKTVHAVAAAVTATM